jgi:hypothetical protein
MLNPVQLRTPVRAQVAETIEEAKRLREAGFEHYDTVDGRHLREKRKL